MVMLAGPLLGQQLSYERFLPHTHCCIQTSVVSLQVRVEKASLLSESPIIGGVQHDINFISDDNAYH